MKNKTLILKACILLAGFFTNIVSYGQNQSLADSLISSLKKIKTDTVRYRTLWKIALNHTDQDSVLFYSNVLIKGALLSSNDRWVYNGYLQQGHGHNRKGDLDLALDSYFNAEKHARKINHMSGIGNIFVAVGDVYSINNNHENSVLYYNKAISILRNSTDSINLASALLNAGDEYFNYEELDTALIYFKESGIIFKLQNYELGSAYNLGNVGLVYAKQGKHDLAEENINAATEILERLNDRYPIAVYDTYMADIYLEKGDFPRALSYAKNSLKIGEEEGLKEQIRDGSLKLSEVYKMLADYQNAYRYQTQYIVYRDSINNEKTIQNLADQRTEYEVSQKQIEVDLLEQQKRIQQIIGYAMGAVILLVVILVIVIYRTSRQRQLTNTLLARQKVTVEKQRDQLEGLNNTKDRFFSIISHDLRGPVNAFAGVAELIRHYVKDKAYDDLMEVTEHIDQSSSQLSTLLDNLLNWAVSQQGEFPYVPEQVNLLKMGNELQGVFKNMSAAKGIRLVTHIAPEVNIWADQNSVMTILRNLINNALKFTENGGEIILFATSNDDDTIIRVQDTGVGIPEEKLSSLFQLQEKKSTWGTEGEKGLGLGLQLAYEFATMNKGTIVVESEVGVGTTFTVTLPTSSN